MNDRMNDRMTFDDWVFVLLLLGCFLFISCHMVHYQSKPERLDSQLRELKEECVQKGVATYTFDTKGNVIFTVLEQNDKWDISLSSSGRSYDCVCPECAKEKDGAK